MRYWLIGWLIIFFSVSAFANKNNDNQQSQLKSIIQQIANLKTILQKKHNKRDALLQELNKIETQYGDASKKKQQIDLEITKQNQAIQSLENQSFLNKNQTDKQIQALKTQLQATYLLQQQGPLKMILNQQDLAQMERMLFYYQALNQYRITTIQQLQIQLHKINDQQKELYLQYQQLRILQQQQQHQTQNLATMKTNRSQLIDRFNQKIKDQKQQLDNLSVNKKRLEQTLIRLAQHAKQTQAHFINLNFAALQGHLHWPTKGSVLHYFNTSIQQSELKWTGELIAAPDEQPVYAVATGTVVFSQWLQGYGLLIIINHGNGYMTLYGRNHSLYKKEGEKINAGDLIATVGQSGGYDKPALYFAIRHNAKPLDPNRWCIGN